MTENERVVAKLQGKFNRNGMLTGDEDFELEVARENVAKHQVNKRSTMVTQAQVDRLVKAAMAKEQAKFSKAMHLSDDDEQHLRNLRDTVRAANSHLDKISFDDREPSGGELESRTPADATMPAKAAGVDVNRLKGRDLARLVGVACCKAAQAQPTNMNSI
jgi:hypothetical protein